MPSKMRLEFEYTQTETQPAYRRSSEGPLRILVLADLSGRENRGLLETGTALASRPVVSIDVDNLDDVLFRFAPRLQLPLVDPAGPAMGVEFKSLDDFHPDRLYERLDLFQALRRTRARLSDPATFERAAAELKYEASPETVGRSDQAPAEDEGDMLARLLGKKSTDAPVLRSGGSGSGPADISKLIGKIVGPYVVAGPDPRRAELVASVDSAIAAEMRSLLRNHAFQGLESAWRSVHWLVRELELGEELTLHVVDVTKQELLADLQTSAGDLKASGAYRLLADSRRTAPGERPWGLLVGGYAFGPNDSGLLAALGTLAAGAGGPFLAQGDPGLVGCSSFAAAPDPAEWKTPDPATEKSWNVLRHSAAAAWLGLATPRVLLRLPYGRKTEAIDSFQFEELPAGRDHGAYLWGNPAFACALLIGAAFLRSGWKMEPGEVSDIGNLPTHIFEDRGERKMMPATEIGLSERAGEAILARGLMPLLAYRDRDSARLLRFQSLADPPAGLAGPWG